MANQNLSTRLNAGAAAVVIPGTSDGLVSKNGVPGNTTGSAIAAGYVGETVSRSDSVTPVTANYVTSGGALVLSAGIWQMWAYVGSGTGAPANAGVTSVLVGISTSSTSTTFADISEPANCRMGAVSGSRGGVGIYGYPVNITTSTSYYGKALCWGANFASPTPLLIGATRIA